MRNKRRKLVNETMDAYLGWREQCGAVWIAYSRWSAARPCDAGLWHAAYWAALDREERAAERYANLIRRLGNLVAADLEPIASLTPAGARR
ncbi:MAG TPA: hypothetical protein VK778_06950 [Solirubrobacteraceae bacterium]|jgi:hypothetical protein|nr:hypothetical protein [Solirubrobacteraceae bacterium]